MFGVAVVDAPNPRDTHRGCTEGQPKPPKRGRIIRALTVTLIALTITTLSTAGEPRTSGAVFDSRCSGSWHAVRWYRTKYNQHRATLGRTLAPPVEQGMDCARLRERAKYWQTAAATNRLALKEWRAHHYGWTAWMPRGSKWYRVASCETGYGRDPNWAHDSGTYVSAFGIYRAGYADDAHRVGNLSWDETRRQLGRLPTPREQFEAALSHYRAHGGFSGWGCRGA